MTALPDTFVVSSADNLCNRLDPDHAGQDVKPDLDPNCVTLMIFLKEILKKNLTAKIDKKKNFPACKEFIQFH